MEEKVRGLQQDLRDKDDEIREIHNLWVPAWKEQTKNLRIALTLADADETLLNELQPVSAPFKLGETKPVRKSPSVERRAPSPSAKRSRR